MSTTNLNNHLAVEATLLCLNEPFLRGDVSSSCGCNSKPKHVQVGRIAHSTFLSDINCVCLPILCICVSALMCGSHVFPLPRSVHLGIHVIKFVNMLYFFPIATNLVKIPHFTSDVAPLHWTPWTFITGTLGVVVYFEYQLLLISKWKLVSNKHITFACFMDVQ